MEHCRSVLGGSRPDQRYYQAQRGSTISLENQLQNPITYCQVANPLSIHALIGSWLSFLGFFSDQVRKPRQDVCCRLSAGGGSLPCRAGPSQRYSSGYVILHLLVLHDWTYKLFDPLVDTQPSVLNSRRAGGQTVSRQRMYRDLCICRIPRPVLL
jgi:hypothetical protein